jgi:hypothetical protein
MTRALTTDPRVRYESAVANAVNKVNNSHLTAMYRERVGGRKSAG